MNEQCNQCYWKASKNTCIKRIKENKGNCESFSAYCSKCDYNEEEYEYKGEKYCGSCLIEELKIKVETIYIYNTSDGETLGDESDNMIDIFKKVDNEVKEV